MSDILSELQPIFRDILDQPNLVITRDSSASTVEGWDSLTHVNLIWNIEQEFSVHFGLGELQDLKNVGDLIDVLERKIGKMR